MENYFYKCPVCGYVHLIPAYWMEYSPQDTYELEHIHADTGETCSCNLLNFQKDIAF